MQARQAEVDRNAVILQRRGLSSISKPLINLITIELRRDGRPSNLF